MKAASASVSASASTSASASSVRTVRPGSGSGRRTTHSLRVRRNRAVVLTVLILLALVTTALLARVLVRRSLDNTRLRFVRTGTLYRSTDTRALVLRDEQLLKTETNGVLLPLVGEGTQIAYGRPLAMLVPSEVTETKDGKPQAPATAAETERDLAALAGLRKQIAYRQLELVGKGQGEGALPLYEKMEERMQTLLQTWAPSIPEGDLTETRNADRNVQSLMEERNRQINYFSFEDATLAELMSTLNREERQLQNRAKTYLSPAAGVVSWTVDGLEDALQASKAGDLTPEKLATLFDDSRAFRSLAGKLERDVPLARLVSSRTQAFVFRLPLQGSEALAEADSLHCFLPDYQIDIPQAKVVRRLKDEHYVYLVAQTEAGLDALLRVRRLNVQLRTESETGLIVPASSLLFLTEDRSTARLMTVQSGFAHQLPVRVRLLNGDSAVVEPLQEADKLVEGSLVIQNPGNLKEGDRVE